MWANLKKQWFLVGLAFTFATGFFAEQTLNFLLDWQWLRSSIVFAVMWATGVTLRADAIRNSIATPLPALLAIGINVVGVPLLCLPFGWLPARLLSAELFGGLFVASLVPCTLASAAVWTRKAGGDDSIALLTTVVTNVACVLVVPIGMSLVLGQVAELSASEQMAKLSLIVVLPLSLAQVLRHLGLAAWADRNKTRLGVAAQCGILLMVFFGAIASGQRIAGAGESLDVSGLLTVVLGALLIHLVAWSLGIFSSRAVGSCRDRQIAVGFAGSQKTLMVGLQIAIDSGVSVIPMIAYHLGQLFLDTLIAEHWRAGRQRDAVSTVEKRASP